MNRKAISPVVAIALLLVVAVVAVVSFQSWFTSYQSSMFSDIEIQSNSAIDGSLTIDKLIGNWLYIINNVENGLNVTTLKIGDNICSLDNLTLGMNEVDVSSCIDSTDSVADVVLITDKQIVAKKVLVDGVSSGITHLKTEAECRFADNLSGCEDYYINATVDGIPAIHDTLLGLYWQKNASAFPTMNWTNAQNNCSNLGSGWRLSTLVELEASLIDNGQAGDPYVVGGSSLFDGFGTSRYYWTNTKYSSTGAYVVSFSNGVSGGGGLAGSLYVLCVKTA